MTIKEAYKIHSAYMNLFSVESTQAPDIIVLHKESELKNSKADIIKAYKLVLAYMLRYMPEDWMRCKTLFWGRIGDLAFFVNDSAAVRFNAGSEYLKSLKKSGNENTEEYKTLENSHHQLLNEILRDSQPIVILSETGEYEERVKILAENAQRSLQNLPSGVDYATQNEWVTREYFMKAYELAGEKMVVADEADILPKKGISSITKVQVKTDEKELQAQKYRDQRDTLITILPTLLILEGLIFIWVRKLWIGPPIQITPLATPNGQTGFFASLSSYLIGLVVNYVVLASVFAFITVIVQVIIEKRRGYRIRSNNHGAYIVFALIAVVVSIYILLCVFGLMRLDYLLSVL